MRDALKLLARSASGHPRDVAGWAAWSVVEAVPVFLSGLLIARAVDRGFLRGDIPTGLGWLGALGLAVVIGAVGTRRAYSRLAALVEPFRDGLARRAVRGTLAHAARSASRQDPAGVARLTQQVEIAREAYGSVLVAAQGFLVTGASALLGLLTLVPAAALLVGAPLAAACVVFALLLGPMAARQRASILADERLAHDAGRIFAGLRDVAACGGERVAAEMLGARIDEQMHAAVRVARMSALRSLTVAVGGWLPIVLILLRGSALARHGVSTGAILGAITYVLQAVHPAIQGLVRDVGNTGAWLLVTLRRLGELDRPPEATAATRTGQGPVRGGAVSLRGVRFAYGARADPVLSGLDLDVAAGEHLAIVGPSGVGKSTLANLIAGVLEPGRGEVRLCGEAVAGLSPAELARRRVLIPQEAYVFTGSLWANLTYLHPEATGDEVRAAAARLGAQSLVLRLGGYGAGLAPASLSAGERQLIALVRAIVSPAPLVILDEATCHLDPGAEERVERAFAERDGTLIVVAHRMSSALRAGRVLVLDGTRPDLGRHDELLARSALYRDLVGHWQAPRRLNSRAPCATRHPRPMRRSSPS